MAAVAMLAMNSCEKENEMNTGEQKGTPVEFEMNISSTSTKTATDDNYATTFQNGDAVGIYQIDNTGVVVANAQYVYDGTNWNASGDKKIYAQEGSTYSYYAYYPYKADAGEDPSSIAMTIENDQTSGFEKNDALMANNSTVTSGSSKVELTFSHAFALVQVNLKGDEAKKEATVTLRNIFPTATLNLTGNTVLDATGSTTEVKMWSHSDNATFVYRAIVPAQTIKAGKALLEVSVSGKQYRLAWSDDLKYEAGKLRVINVTIGKGTETAISIPAADVNIDKWGNSEAATGSGTSSQVIDATLELTQSTQFVVYDAQTGMQANEWYYMSYNNNNNHSTYEITLDDDNTTPVINYILNSNNSIAPGWNKEAIGFTTDKCTEGGVYRLTFQLRALGKFTPDNNEKAGVAVFPRNAQGFATATSAGFVLTSGMTETQGKSYIYCTNTDNEWKDFSIDFDITKIISGSVASGLKDYTSNSDFSNVIIGMTYNGTLGHTIQLKNIKLVKVVAD